MTDQQLKDIEDLKRRLGAYLFEYVQLSDKSGEAIILNAAYTLLCNIIEKENN